MEDRLILFDNEKEDNELPLKMPDFKHSIKEICGINVIIDNRMPKNIVLIINNGKCVGKFNVK